MTINFTFLRNKLTQTGSLIECPVCERWILKENHKQICCNLECEEKFYTDLFGKEFMDKRTDLLLHKDINKELPLNSYMFCAYCHKETIKVTANKLFCSNECRNKYHNATKLDRAIRIEYRKALEKLFKNNE